MENSSANRLISQNIGARPEDSSRESFQNTVHYDGHKQQQQQQQNQGDETSEQKQSIGEASTVQPNQLLPQKTQGNQHATTSAAAAANAATSRTVAALGSNPGEVTFFKLLHTEVKKATHFFEQAQQEYQIREERVRTGIELITSQQNEYGSYVTNNNNQNGSIKSGRGTDEDNQWPRLAQSIFRLYRELLLLETFCIMAYCGFSKILKKHDKLTGHTTKNAFMAKIVNQANFVNYPRVLEMIARCERLYEDVSQRLVQQGQQGMYEDERLFIHMIHRLNQQCSVTVTPGSSKRPSASSSTTSPSSPVAHHHAAMGGGGSAVATNPNSSKSDDANKHTSAVVSLLSSTTDQSRKLQELVADIEEDKHQQAVAKTASAGTSNVASSRTSGNDNENIDQAEDAASLSSASSTASSVTGGGKRKAIDTSTISSPSAQSRKRQHTDSAET